MKFQMQCTNHALGLWVRATIARTSMLEKTERVFIQFGHATYARIATFGVVADARGWLTLVLGRFAASLPEVACFHRIAEQRRLVGVFASPTPPRAARTSQWACRQPSWQTHAALPEPFAQPSGKTESPLRNYSQHRRRPEWELTRVAHLVLPSALLL